MAKNKIKGLTVEIGGDSTKLGKALDESKKKSKSLQSELKQVEKLLKLDPKNVELLSQKQKILTEQVEETKKRLALMKDEQAKVNAMFQKGEIGEEEYRKYRREVEQTELTLKNLEKQLKTTGDEFAEVQRKSGAVTFKNAEDKVEHFKGKVKDMTKEALKDAEKLAKGFDKVGDGLEKAGSVINKGSAAAAAVLAGSVASFKDLDEGYDVIVKKTGATDDKFESLKKTADELFSGSTFDMTDIGNALGEVNTRFGYTEDKLKSVTEQYLQFAKINDADVSDSISKTARIMQAWDISADNLPDLLGMITAKGQETGVAVGGLMDKVLDNNATFKEMGLSLEESITLMAQFERNGVNDSTALTAMKTAVKNAAKEGKPLSDVLRENVNDIKNASNETEALQKATELFGTKGAAEMANAIKEGRIDFDNLSGSMSSYKNTVKNTYDATLDPLEESKQVINNLKLAGADLAATALKEGQPLIEDVIDGVKGVTNWLKKLTPEEKKTLTEAIKIVAVAGPAVTIGGKLTKGIGSIIGFLPKMVKMVQSTTVAQKGWNAALNANPIGAVALAITAFIAVVGGGIAAINAFHDAQLENAGFKAQIENLDASINKLNELKGGMKETSDALKDSMNAATNEMGVIDNYKTRLDELLSKASLTDAEQADLVTIADYFSKKYPEFEATWNDYIHVDENGKVQITGDIEVLKEKLDDLIDSYKRVAAQAALTQLAQENAVAVVQSRTQVRDSAVEYTKALDEYNAFIKEWDLSNENAEKLAAAQPWFEWENVDKSKKVLAGDLLNQYNELTQKMGDAQKSYNEVTESAAQLRVNGDDLARMQAVVNGNFDDAAAVMMTYGEGLSTVSDIENSQWKTLDNLATKAREASEETGENLVFGLNKGVRKYQGDISEQGIKSAELFLESTDIAYGIKSPSKEMYKRGVYVVQGFVNGIRDGMKTVWDVAQNLGSTALNAVKSFLGIQSPSKEAYKIGDYFTEGFNNALRDGNPEAMRNAEKLAQTARDALGGKLHLFDENSLRAPVSAHVLTDYSVSHTLDFKRSAQLESMRNDIRVLSGEIDKLAQRPIRLYVAPDKFVGGTIDQTYEQLSVKIFEKERGL